VGLTTAFFAFYTPIWVGNSLASIAVEAMATFQIWGEKINPVTKMSRFTRPFGLGVLAGRVGREKRLFPQNKTNAKTNGRPDQKTTKSKQPHINYYINCYILSDLCPRTV
jgi:hypothetical protein